MQKYLNVFFFVLMTITSGCSHFRHSEPEKEYVSNISYDKIVVVVPFNDYIHQIEVARKIEMALVNYGFNVKSYQAGVVKDVEKRSGAGIANATTQGKNSSTDASVALGEAVTIERFKEYETTILADIRFEVLASNNEITLKVVRHKDSSVIGVATFGEGSFDDLQDFLLQKNLIAEKIR